MIDGFNFFFCVFYSYWIEFWFIFFRLYEGEKKVSIISSARWWSLKKIFLFIQGQIFFLFDYLVANQWEVVGNNSLRHQRKVRLAIIRKIRDSRFFRFLFGRRLICQKWNLFTNRIIYFVSLWLLRTFISIFSTSFSTFVQF